MNTLPATLGRDVLGTVHAFWQLTKPAVTRLVMVTMLCGALLAPGRLDVVRLVVALVSTALVVGAANALNMYLERESDAAMERTRGRPLPSGRLAPEAALWFGFTLGGIGLAVLGLAVNPTAALLAAIALLSYVLVYTPLKRITPLALHVGAVPGAIPPLIGWASVQERLTLEAFALFAILFFWQLPHFLAIAIFRQREYERAGLRVYPSARGLPSTKRHVVATLVLLCAASALPLLVGPAGALYSAIAAVSGAAFLVCGVAGLRASAGARWARTLFFVSLPYLVVVLGGLVLERRLF
jgi:protoheme IX farnesyltransferase